MSNKGQNNIRVDHSWSWTIIHKNIMDSQLWRLISQQILKHIIHQTVQEHRPFVVEIELTKLSGSYPNLMMHDIGRLINSSTETEDG